MKIAFYINAINGGGAARALTVLANGLARRGCETVFVTSYPCETEYGLDKEVVRVNLEPKKIEDSFFQRNVRRVASLRGVL